MPAATLASPTTPTSALSSSTSIQNNSAIQNGPYTKAQFQSTMEGSRSIKNGKEIEQLLRDYPAALELYRTGKYKVKVKYEADVERVILVEKRSSKNATNNGSTNSAVQERDSSAVDVSKDIEKQKLEVRKDRDSRESRSRTQSRDRVASGTSASNGNSAAHATTSSKVGTSEAPNKVNQYQGRPSKERETSVTSQSKQSQHRSQKHHGHRRSQSRESASIISHTRQPGRKSHRDHARMVVPYVPNNNPATNMWNPARALQPYYSHPILQQQQPQQQPNMYMPPNFLPQHNGHYHQPYTYGQQPPPSFAYSKPSTYPGSSTLKSTSNVTNTNPHSTSNYSSSSRSVYNSNHAVGNLPPSFHTFHPNQQQYQQPDPYPIYQQQMPMGWPTATNGQAGGMPRNQEHSTRHRTQSKDRGVSIDQGPRSYPPPNTYASRQHHHHQQQQQPLSQKQVIVPPFPTQTGSAVEHFHHHRHHHHRGYPTTASNNPMAVPTTDVTKEPTGLPPLVSMAPAPTIATNTNGEKLTIRQLNEIFLQSDLNGRLAYGSIPNVLQRFGIALTEQALTSAAQSLEYNTAEPISARRLVHVLVKLGKIAKSTSHPPHAQQRPTASPSMLPEDREVTAIMTQRPVASNLMNTTAYANPWHQ